MKNRNRRAHDRNAKKPSLISKGSFISGVIKGTAPVIVLGTVEGDCEIENALSIEITGEWIGSIRAQSVIINGSVKGNVFTETILEVGSTGKIQGNVTAGTLAIASGAEIDGDIIMANEEEPVYFEEKRSNA